MAGNYPNAPSWRMGYDTDGTQGYRVVRGVVTPLSGTDLVNLNNEATGDAVLTAFGMFDYGEVVLIFPEKRDLDAFFGKGRTGGLGGGTATVTTSVDSTNGVDGTWTTAGTFAIGTFSDGNAKVAPDYREAVSTTKLGIQAVKFAGASALMAIHIYGEITAGQTLDRLLVWHPTLDERVSPSWFDWGDVPRNSSDTRQFRIKNMSPTKTATNVRVAMEVLTNQSPSVPGQHALSLNGGSYTAQQTISTLAPGAVSGILTLRRLTPANAQLGAGSFRVFSEAQSWA